MLLADSALVTFRRWLHCSPLSHSSLIHISSAAVSFGNIALVCSNVHATVSIFMAFTIRSTKVGNRSSTSVETRTADHKVFTL